MTAERAPGDLILIGRVARAHGLRGELRVELHYGESDALERVDELWLAEQPEHSGGAALYALEYARAVPKAYLVKLEGVGDRNASEALRGRSVWVPRAALPADESEYFLVDLIGARVVGPEGEVGVVEQVATHPSVDALVIRTPDGRTVEQPLLDDWIARVSVAERLIELSSLDGLVG